VRKDIILSAREYKSMVRDLQFISATSEHGSITAQQHALDVLKQLRDYRCISEENIIGFKNYLENLEGQKHIFLFYQKTIIPVPENRKTSDLYLTWSLHYSLL